MKKRTQMVALIASVALMAGCDAGNNASNNHNGANSGNVPAIPTIAQVEQNNAPVDNISAFPEMEEAPIVSSITFNVTGKIDPNKYEAGKMSGVTFSGFPQSVDGFQSLQERLGTSPEGAVLLELMAFEIYCHNQTAGKQCLALANVDNNVECVHRILRDRYNPSMGNYYTPQLVASYLEGATPMNGYKANKPFKMVVRTHTVNKYEDVESLRGTVISLQVKSTGYDSEWRAVTVVKSKGSSVYKVVNNPSMYTQCKPVSFKCDDEYVDICHQ